MVTKAEEVRAIIQHRKSISSSDLPLAARKMFELAMQDEDAAMEMLSAPGGYINSLILNLFKLLGQNDHLFINFAVTYPHLIGLLIERTRLETQDSFLANRLRDFQTPAQVSEENYGRTHLLKDVPAIQFRSGSYFYNYQGHDYPVVSRHTRDFSSGVLFSLGASDSREYIKLDPNSTRLNELYGWIKRMIRPAMSTEEILTLIMQWTRKIFYSTDIERFVDASLAAGNKVIGLEAFTISGVGVCRHHTLLNAYCLSRLVADKILNGEVIHHRQNILDGAHTWNLFSDSQTKKLYSLDSLWNKLICVSENPGALNELYQDEVEQLIQDRFNLLAPADSKPTEQPQIVEERRHPEEEQEELDDFPADSLPAKKKGTQDALNHQPAEVISKIKNNIESQTFHVGNYFFFQGGKNISINSQVKKRVPHRVADIYHLILKLEERGISAEECLASIKEAAHQAIVKPRPGRKQTTTAFYNSILEENLPEIIDSRGETDVHSL